MARRTPLLIGSLVVAAMLSTQTLSACKKKSTSGGGAKVEKRDLDDDEDEEHDEKEEAEEKSALEEHHWRVALTLVGEGRVKTNIQGIPAIAIDCVRDAKGQSGDCGPKLLKWREKYPALLAAYGAPGWKFVRFESRIREKDGNVHPSTRELEPGLRLYINAFGTSDTGQTELLTVVFEKQDDPTYADVDRPAPPIVSDAAMAAPSSSHRP